MFRNVLRGFGSEARVLSSSVKGHAADCIEELELLYWGFGETVLQVTKIVTAKGTQFG